MPMSTACRASVLLSVLLLGAARTPEPVTPAERQRALAFHAGVKRRLLRAGGIRPLASREPEVTAVLQSRRARARQVLDVDDGHIWAIIERDTLSPLKVMEWHSAYAPGLTEDGGSPRPSRIRPIDVPQLAGRYLAAIEQEEPEGAAAYEPELVEMLGTDEDPHAVALADVINVQWPRSHRGFRFRDDRSVVAIRAFDGSFRMYARVHNSDPPPSVDVVIGAEEAADRARAAGAAELAKQARFGEREPKDVVPEGVLLASRRAYERALEARRAEMREWAAAFGPLVEVEPVLEGDPELMIVNPNNEFSERYPDEGWSKWTPKTRLAWVVRLVYEAPADAPQAWPHLHMEVWIDAENGKLLGGHLPY